MIATSPFELPPDERLELARRLVESVVAPEPLNEAVLEASGGSRILPRVVRED